LLPKLYSHNQPQQAKALPVQKSSKGTVKCKRQAGHLRVKTGRVQSLEMPVFSRSFVQQTPDFILQMADFSARQKLAGLKQLSSPNRASNWLYMQLGRHC
jgi:hypothetical protein